MEAKNLFFADDNDSGDDEEADTNGTGSFSHKRLLVHGIF